jgi:hypothetical protein
MPVSRSRVLTGTIDAGMNMRQFRADSIRLNESVGSSSLSPILDGELNEFSAGRSCVLSPAYC